ncbi:MAG: CoF synthetase [Bacteroidia bacterium]|nr:CoF synthetase [Bacteroidia bacterium]
MIFSAKCRSAIFWFTDLLNGNKIKGNYKDISNAIQKPFLTASHNIASEILLHAINSTKFYNSFPINSNLQAFPIVNKSIIREQYSYFVSNAFKKSELITVITSGSTGTPFKTYQDKKKKLRNYADTIYFAELAGFQIGHRLVYLKIWAKQKMKNPAFYWLQNVRPVDVIKLDEKQIAGLIKEMESQKSTFGILGYSSALELVCQFLDKYHPTPVRAKVNSIITMSESLNEYTKASLQKYFGVPAVSRYSNLENGIIAQQETNGSGRFLVNTASYFVEILKLDSDEPAADGEIGRIVVTDLFNYAMPMIRYDTGDLGAIERDASNPGRLYLSRVEGRKLDMLYDTSGNIVSSYIMYKNMWQYTEIKQYQLIQEGEKDYLFKINADKSFNRETQLVSEFKSYLGLDASFIVEYVDEIPLLDSGKRRKLVNNYKPAH